MISFLDCWTKRSYLLIGILISNDLEKSCHISISFCNLVMNEGTSFGTPPLKKYSLLFFYPKNVCYNYFFPSDTVLMTAIHSSHPFEHTLGM